MFKLLWKKIILTIAGAILALGGAGAGYKIVKERRPADLEKEPQLVLKVIDADTIKIKDNIRVRFLGINAPDKGECYYEEARNFAKYFLENKYVNLEKDISGKDKYDRLLRYVILLNENQEEDNILVNDYFVRKGYARAIASPPDNRYRQLLSSAQEEAKKNNLGLWKECEIKEDKSAKLREKNIEPANPDCVIKGNISEKGYGKTYLIPGCDNYNRVKIDPRKGEQYFCTENEAQKAGFRKATNCP
jgi:micrococcal nuclease